MLKLAELIRKLIGVYDEEMRKYVSIYLMNLGHLAIKWHNR
jgi:hypothetical protein